MTERISENQICANCGADVRPNTLFCYNCGSSVDPNADKNKSASSAVAEIPLAETSKKTINPKLKSAAALRGKSKLTQRKPVEIVWDAPENAPNAWFLGAAIILILFVIGIIYAMFSIR